MKLHRVLQHFPRPRVDNLEATVHQQMGACGDRFPKGASIAVAVGSRGIANLSQITRVVVDFLKAAEARPFIVPAMGSHGGATAQGQAELLASFGITAEAMGCPVRSSMEVVELTQHTLPHRLFADRLAWESDGVVLVNRIKGHTDFQGPFGSGLAKMAVIGLGKEKAAFEMHRYGVRGLRDMVPVAACVVLASGKILAGVGIIENGYDETALVEVIPGESIAVREPELLAMARSYQPRLPVDALDLLWVDQLGKNISGTGLDTNVIGRIRIAGEPEPSSPRIGAILVTDLTAESHGNATGIGLADVITRRLRDKIDFGVTYTNIITSGFLERGKMPLVAETDEQAMEIALRSAGCLDPARARVIRIRDTLHLSELFVSDAVLEEMRGRPNIEIV